jgi:predicted anti-sigma-YlaC factor YlaD
MTVAAMSEACSGARAQVSRRLDGELSQLEERMLTSHLGRCSDCRAFASDVASFTRDLREAPLEPLGFPIVVGGRRRRVVLARAQFGIAAAVAVAVISSVLQLAIPRSTTSGQAFRSPTQFPTTAQVAREVHQLIADGRAFDRHKQGGRTLPM